MSGAAAAAGGERRTAERQAGIVFALLVVACVVAFFVTQRLKHTPSLVPEYHVLPVFSPTPAGHLKLEQLDFKLAQADRVTVEIIDSEDDLVATLMKDHPVPRYRVFYLRWNGRRGPARSFGLQHTPAGMPVLVPHNSGTLAPSGVYRVRLVLHGEDRELTLPHSFRLAGG